ncbi:hypothetical protein DXG03_005567 [Asterophora parasitica]|uniref:Acyl-protein thioesterase 1 n=1 Tax=Asterophora parasitica TaxID=117018 RepID=A0A9P7G5P5_9AGAR|nr:hypothetical protein DXG03_005567 [Asterophora parasitica]
MVGKEDLVLPNQFGGRPSSTNDALLTHLKDIQAAHNHGKVTAVLIFDISGYFDNVNHARLRRKGIPSRKPTRSKKPPKFTQLEKLAAETYRPAEGKGAPPDTHKKDVAKAHNAKIRDLQFDTSNLLVYSDGSMLEDEDDLDVKNIGWRVVGFHTGREVIVRRGGLGHTAEGLGDSGKGMQDVAKYLRSLGGVEHVKFIFPTAHRMVVTGALQAVMNSWIDAFSFDYENREEDRPGLDRAAELINDIISKEVTRYKIPSHRIIVGGISQGSSVSVFTGVTTKRPLGGIFVLAGYVPLRRIVKELATPDARNLPFFWGHGRIDPRLKIRFSVETAQTLSADLGIPFYESVERLKPDDFKEPGSSAGLRFVTYDDLGHWMDNTMMEDLNVWIRAILTKNPAEEQL